jgi:hypothetical protein
LTAAALTRPVEFARLAGGGVLLSTNVYDFAIVEEVVEIFDADVIMFGASFDDLE